MGPVEHIERVIEWLEGEQRSGILEHSYTTATLVAVVSDAETWTWHVGPHGVACGRRTGVRFRSTDLRYPVLQKLGVMKPSGFQSAGTGPRDQASSIYCIGTPTGYERLRMHLEPDDVAVAFEVGSFPFGPLPSDPVPLHALWAMDAAWRHGLQGVGVTVGFLGTEDLELPESWQVREELLSLA